MRGLENYIPVKQRIHDMREDHPDWAVTTELELDDDHWYARATITDDQGRTISNGHAVERNTKPFDAEKTETSAVGRALVFAGWTDSLELSPEEQERSATVHAPAEPTVDYELEAKVTAVALSDGDKVRGKALYLAALEAVDIGTGMFDADVLVAVVLWMEDTTATFDKPDVEEDDAIDKAQAVVETVLALEEEE